MFLEHIVSMFRMEAYECQILFVFFCQKICNLDEYVDGKIIKLHSKKVEHKCVRSLEISLQESVSNICKRDSKLLKFQLRKVRMFFTQQSSIFYPQKTLRTKSFQNFIF